MRPDLVANREIVVASPRLADACREAAMKWKWLHLPSGRAIGIIFVIAVVASVAYLRWRGMPVAAWDALTEAGISLPAAE